MPPIPRPLPSTLAIKSQLPTISFTPTTPVFIPTATRSPRSIRVKTVPRPKHIPAKRPGFQFLHRGIVLDFRAQQTRFALSKLKGNWHLFLRNQPRSPAKVSLRKQIK